MGVFSNEEQGAISETYARCYASEARQFAGCDNVQFRSLHTSAVSFLYEDPVIK
jgi:hypothetical protein